MGRLTLALVVLALCATPRAQNRDASTVLAEMRQALGGAAALDTVQTLSVGGSLTQRIAGHTKQLSSEHLILLPDHYLNVRRDNSSTGPMQVDITYYTGFRGDVPIRRTDANVPFPPDPFPNTPDALAARNREMLLGMKRELARLSLVLLGRAPDSYPLDFAYVGVGQEGGRNFDVIDARAADGFVLRLAVDAQTHLPAVLSWVGPAEFVTTTSSVVAMRGNEVVSKRDEVPVTPAIPPPGTPGQPRKLVLSDFKRRTA